MLFISFYILYVYRILTFIFIWKMLILIHFQFQNFLQKNTEYILFKQRHMKDRTRINFCSAEFKQMTKENR